MTGMKYVGLIHKDEGSDYGISFPDVPGCVSTGATADAASRNAVAALALHIGAMVYDGEAIPPARDLDDILSDPELADWRKDAVAVLVPLVLDRGSNVRLNISMDRGLVEAIDAAARQRGMSRSAFLASAARNEIWG